MKNTIENIMKDTRYEKACTYIVNCMGITEVFTKESKSKMIREWGKEEANVFFLNTREVMVNVI